MADKKIQIEVIDFNGGDAVESIEVIDGGQFLTTPIVTIDNGLGNVNPVSSAVVSVSTSGSGTLASPFVITSISVTSGGSGYLGTVTANVTATSSSDILIAPELKINLSTGVIGVLDITDSQDFPLSLNYTVSDGRELENRFGNFSKSFEVPATKNNNRIFSNVYNSQIVNLNNIYSLKDCRILVDSLEFFVGKIQIKGSLQDKNPKSYSCTIYGGNFAWVSEIQEKRLCDLEFASTGIQTFDFASIQASWSKTQANSEVIYPLISYGDFYPTKAEGGVNAIDVYDISQDWRGWFWVYNILKEIFKNIGYAIDSTFIETANFKKLITHFGWNQNEENAEIQEIKFKLDTEKIGSSTSHVQSIGCTDFNDITTYVLNVGQSVTANLLYDTEKSDIVEAYNTSTGFWTCQQSGRYKAQATANLSFAIDTASPNFVFSLTINFKIVHKDASGNILNTFVREVKNFNSQNLKNNSGQPTNAQSYFNESVNSSGYFYIQENETLSVVVECITVAGTGSFDFAMGFFDYSSISSAILSAPRFLVEFEARDLTIGNQFKMKDVLPCDVKQIEFIKGVSHMFNLQFFTDVQSKKVFIEPYNDFYQDFDTAYNWDNKIDYSEPVKDKYQLGISQEILFQYKKDNADKYLDFLNTDASGNQLRNPKYSYFQKMGDNFSKGVTKFENPLFSPTEQTFDNDTVLNTFTNGVLIPVMWKEIVDDLTVGFECPINNLQRPEKGFSYEPRILYYHGQVVSPNNSNHLTQWSVYYSLTAPYYLNISNYPRATFVDYEDASFPSLSYNDEQITPPLSGTTTTVKGLYNTYYKKMIKQLSKSPRIREVNVNLNIQDIINLDLRRLVFFQGSMWRINKVVDFSPAKNKTTKVELIQWFEL
tara:strand:- start:723 stop:3365 length:2643 start_codon:yes stop_codon:yes gene_type:complete